MDGKTQLTNPIKKKKKKKRVPFSCTSKLCSAGLLAPFLACIKIEDLKVLYCLQEYTKMWCIKAPFEAVNIITLPSFNKHRAENAKYLYKQSALQKLPWEKHNPQSTFKMFSEINVVLIQMSLWDILYNNLLIYRIAPNLLSWPAVIWKIRLLIMLNVTLVLK